MRNLILLLFQLCAFSLSTFSQGWMNFNTTNGMASNSAVVVTSDKFNNIWVGLGSNFTAAGLDKFDGVSWTHYDSSNSAMPVNGINALVSDTSGNLWIGFAGAMAGLAKFDGTNWTSYNTNNSGIFSNSIVDVEVDSENNIWISCGGAVSKFDGTSFTNYPSSMVGALLVEDSTSVWLAGIGLDHLNPTTGAWTHYNQSNSGCPGGNLGCIAKDTSGLIWLGFTYGFNGGQGSGGSNGGLSTFDGTTFTPIWPFQDVYTGVYGLAIDRSNNIWVSTRCEGLYQYDGTTWTNIAGPPPNGCSFTVTYDLQNFIWYAEVYSGIWTNRAPVASPQRYESESVKLFPNPTNSTITVDIQKCSNLKVYNVLGEVLIEKDFAHVPNHQVVLDVSPLASGVYYIQVGDQFGKFVRE